MVPPLAALFLTLGKQEMNSTLEANHAGQPDEGASSIDTASFP